MKKLFFLILSLCMVFTVVCNTNDVQATDFEGQEDKYIKICSSQSLAKSKQSTCKEFNKYLKNKNSELKNEISSEKSDISKTSSDISEVESQISELKKEISEKESEISYIQISIEKKEKEIEEKNELMKERLYLMQDTYNSDSFVQFLFGAENFSDFFSRATSINDITAYENELIEELTEEKKELDDQKQTLETAKANLEAEKEEANKLQEELTALKKEQEEALAASEKESQKISSAQKEIDETLEELTKIVPKADSGGTVVKGTTGDADTGYKIAQAAVSKVGSPYCWGATGPNMFDCSGLVYWAHNNAGVKIGRSSANGYAYSGTAVSYSQLQAGDIVCFKRSGASSYHHVGIYIGGGIVVHASGEGSTCLGNHASLGHVVKRTPLSSFSSYGKTYRRLY